MSEKDEAPTTQEELALASFMRGYSCGIGPRRSADPEEMSYAIMAAVTVLHASFEDAFNMWVVIASEAMDFMTQHAEHMREHHGDA